MHEVTITLLHFSPALAVTASSTVARLQGGSECSATALLMALISHPVSDFVLCFCFAAEGDKVPFDEKEGLLGKVKENSKGSSHI